MMAKSRQRLLHTLAWTAFLLAAALTLAGLVCLVLSWTTPASSFGFRGIFGPVPLLFGGLGLLIARRYPGNPIGWLFLANGCLAALLVFSEYYGVYGLLTRPGLIGASVVIWFQEWAWIPMFGITAAMIPLLFPSGRLLSPRWRVVLGLAIVATVLASAAVGLRPGPLEDFTFAVNPFGIPGAAGVLDPAGNILMVVLTLTAGAAVWSLVLRYRRTGDEERHQLRWVMAAGFLVVCTIGFGASDQPALQTLTLLGLLSVPLAIGISVLKYRLYDIDVVINRGLVYVPLTAILAGFYISGIGVLKAIFTNVTGLGSEEAIAVTTVLVVALLTPLKNSLQTIVDQRFKEVPDPGRALAKFDAQIHQVVDVLSPDLVARRFLKEVAQALRAESGGLYLYHNGSKELAETHGEWAGPNGIKVSLTAAGRDVGEVWLTLPDRNRTLTPDVRARLDACAATVAQAILLGGR